MKSAIESILIANRGEIAVRVARTTREMGIEPVGVFSAADAGSLHIRQMARSMPLGDGPPLETYLSIDRLLDAARKAQVQAIHPGYGFLSESALFARAVAGAGLIWIGPPPEVIEAMGDKLAARRRIKEAGLPVVPGSDESTLDDDDALLRKAAEIGPPLLVKASAGGGGKGMSRIERLEDLPAALGEARRIARSAFGSERVYVERLLEGARHIEFQVFGDGSGSVVHLFERECSVQRRHQKIVEETPSAALDARLRESMGRAAVEAARAVGYVGAGTVEFLLDERKNFYFLEMNTRLQVEHAITEATLGLDLVRSQIQIAAGASLPAGWRGGKLTPQGHAIELRLYAEDPVTFLPRAGRLAVFEVPAGPGIRVDSGVEEGSRVTLEYDPLLAKLIVLGPDRRSAIERARRALSEWVVLGVETNLPLLQAVLASKEFSSGRYSTDLITRLPERKAPAIPDAAWIAAAMALGRREGSATAHTHTNTNAHKAEPWDASSAWRTGA